MQRHFNPTTEETLATARRVDRNLPIKLSAKEAEQNPEFVSLVQQLGQLLTPDVVSQDVYKDFVQARETLRHEKHLWLQSHILHRELQEIIMDYELKSRDISLSVADQEFKEILEQSLNYAEAPDYLSFTPDPSSKISLLGLSADDIQANNPFKQHLPALQQKLIPEMEDRLRKRCENFVSVYHTSTITDSENLALAKASQLPAMVERSLRIIEDEERKLKSLKERREQQFWLYFQTLLDSLSILEKMVNQFHLGKQSQHNKVISDSLLARCDTMCLKIKYVEMQILLDTYTAESVAALTKIKHHLAETTETKGRELTRLNQALQAYASVGFGFDELAEEYGRLSREVENKQWAIDELTKD